MLLTTIHMAYAPEIWEQPRQKVFFDLCEWQLESDARLEMSAYAAVIKTMINNDCGENHAWLPFLKNLSADAMRRAEYIGEMAYRLAKYRTQKEEILDWLQSFKNLNRTRPIYLLQFVAKEGIQEEDGIGLNKSLNILDGLYYPDMLKMVLDTPFCQSVNEYLLFPATYAYPTPAGFEQNWESHDIFQKEKMAC